MIEVKNLVKRYGNHLALDNVSFTIQKGEVVGFLGPNGAGKSTTMNIITGYLSSTEGDVLVDGVSVLEQPEKAKQKIGYLPELPPLYTDMTVNEYLSFVCDLKGVPAKQKEETLARVTKQARISDVRKRLIRNLSKGYKQRVGIARAFVAKPKVIFADEPTGNLDSTTSRQVLYSMLEMAKSYGITFVMVTHEKELAYCGDRIVTIKDGRVLDNVLLGEDEKAENRRRLFGDVTSGDIAEPETTVPEEKKPAARQAKAVAAAVAEKVNQESM